MNTIYLDEQYRTPGIDHLDQYRDSIFYNLLNKSIGERGNAYENIAAKILNKSGYEVTVNPASYGDYDLIVDGKKVEMKASRKASQYDTRKRTYRFGRIRNVETVDYFIFMIITPTDLVQLWKHNSFDDFKEYCKKEDDSKNSWDMAYHPKDTGAELLIEVQMK